MAGCFPGDDGQGGLVEFGEQIGGFVLLAGFGSGGCHGGIGSAFAIRVGVGEGAFQALAAKDDDEAMAFAGFDDDFGVADFFDFAGKQGAEFLGDFGFDATGAAVGDDAFCVERAEIGAGGDVAGLKFEAQAEGFNDAASDLIFQRVVAEQAEVARAAARGDAGRDGDHAALGADAGEGVEVRGAGGFERGEEILFRGGDVAQAVEDESAILAWF